MTNFEIWRNSLTPENYYRISIAFNSYGCVDCPASKYCKEHRDEKCIHNFINWANENVPDKKEKLSTEYKPVSGCICSRCGRCFTVSANVQKHLIDKMWCDICIAKEYANERRNSNDEE